jgi:hypothetical protein
MKRRETSLRCKRRIDGPAGAAKTIGTSSVIARFTAVPMAPDELSTFSSAGESLSMKATALRRRAPAPLGRPA